MKYDDDFLEMPIEEDEPSYNCPDCGDELTFVGYQGNTLEYKCPICGKYFYDDNGDLLSADEYDDKYYEAENESLKEALLPNGALDTKTFDKALHNDKLESDLSNREFSDNLFGIIYRELDRMKSPEAERFEDGYYEYEQAYELLDDEGKKAATDFVVAHLHLPDSPGNEDREPAYFEEWWADGGMDDEAKRDLRRLGISFNKVKTYHDEVLWRFSGPLGSFKKALEAGYFFSLYEVPADVVSPNLKAYIESKNESLTEAKNETLNQAIWDENNELKPEVKETLTKIADTFIKKLEEDDIYLDVDDIVIVGSNANYVYTPQSDIDLHIIFNSSNVEFKD